ncbi:hypothetical protein [Flavivirga eckloniae]|uniref:Bacteriophage lambda Replication protein O N-terminal domain-containing protein n=1 Tax=Flavivirga eckloniae TaxID=1803846 RepID=A0A2K9PPX7_9FLAO|nr:hypothetical protein [Flavivirga eckloniae]AUP79095.1 hypothetical protein C1H87_10435 [Flavivirga eckloniae]
MNYKETTMIPNSLFVLIPNLKSSCIIVLLIIIRQTLGWYDSKTKKRKVRDWISYKQFNKKTGLSIKTISESIKILVELDIIKATDFYGNELRTTDSRKGKMRIYYQCLLVDSQKNTEPYVKKYSDLRKKLPTTKLTPTKLTQQKKVYKRLTDTERLAEILKLKKYP